MNKKTADLENAFRSLEVDYSILENGKKNLEKENGDLNATCERQQSDFQTKAAANETEMKKLKAELKQKCKLIRQKEVEIERNVEQIEDLKVSLGQHYEMTTTQHFQQEQQPVAGNSGQCNDLTYYKSSLCIQWKPFNVITLGQKQTDSNN